MSELSDLSAHLAENLRDVRQRRGLTQAQLAALSHVPRSTVSHLETGSANPTLQVLVSLAAALRLSLEELLAPPRAGAQLFHAKQIPRVARGSDGRVIVHKLLPHPIPGMEIDRITLRPRTSLPGAPHRPGTHEYLYCERGKLRLHVGGDQLELDQGDVAAFPGDQRHSYHNRGSTTAVGFSVVTLAPLPGP